jgi:hypothetical protein
MHHRDERNFDFHRKLEDQMLQMVEKYRAAMMISGGSWPTFITVETK